MIPVLLALVLLAADPPPTGTLVDFGGRNLHIDCRGSGSSTILLLNGLPRYSFHWILVQQDVAQFARVCTYDRAGDTWSDPADGEATVETMLTDLDHVITHISAEKSVILAGHSFGGVLARAYAHEKPQRISTLVLIDSVHPNWTNVVIGGQRKRLSEMTRDEVLSLAEVAKAQYKAPQFEPAVQAPFNKLPEEIQKLHLWQLERLIAKITPEDVTRSLMTQWELYSSLRNVRFGNLPLVVITRSAPEPWVISQQHIAALSTNGKTVIAPDSGHDIEIDNPKAITESLRSIVMAEQQQAK
jgi:pimeloyl-ACP methyl ester carboxylesterase